MMNCQRSAIIFWISPMAFFVPAPGPPRTPIMRLVKVAPHLFSRRYLVAQFMEMLEGRTLLSASPVTIVGDETKLVTDAKAALGVFETSVATFRTDRATLIADVKALPRTKTNNALVLKLSKNELAAAAVITADGKKLIAVDEAAVRTAVLDGLKDYANPTAANNAKLATAIQNAENLAAKPLAKLEADLNSTAGTLNADLNALGAANPSATKLTSDIFAAEAAETAARGQLTAQVATIQGDLSTLVTDLNA